MALVMDVLSAVNVAIHGDSCVVLNVVTQFCHRAGKL